MLSRCLATVRELVTKEIIPYAAPPARRRVPGGHRRRMCELGLFGPTIAEEYGGGPGESLLTCALVVEELARGGCPAPASSTHVIVAYLVGRHGTAEQKRRADAGGRFREYRQSPPARAAC